jgi:hypothetical protein
VWKEIQSGSEWIVDADLRDFFGSVDHEKLLTLVAQRVSAQDGAEEGDSKNGGNNVRVLSIPTIRDRVVQGALKRLCPATPPGVDECKRLDFNSSDVYHVPR